MKYIVKALIFSLAFMSSAHADNLGVETIETIDTTTIEVTLTENPNLDSEEINAEVAILNDLVITSIEVEESASNIIEIEMAENFVSNMKYSLVGILWSSGSIDFVIPEEVIWFIDHNDEVSEDQNIESIEIVGPKTIHVVFSKDFNLEGNEDYEFKFLLENDVEKIEKKDFMAPVLTIYTKSQLKSDQEYILMFIDIQDVDGNYLEFDTWIYDFTTSDLENSSESVMSAEEKEEEESTETQDMEKNASTEEKQSAVIITPLNAAPAIEKNSGGIRIVEDIGSVEEFEASLDAEIEKGQYLEDIKQIEKIQKLEQEWVLQEKEAEVITKNIEKVAMNVSETPATWAETLVLIIVSLFINTIYYFTRRKKLSYI